MPTPTAKEIEYVLDQCVQAEADCDSQYPDMTFEQGVKYAIEWMQGKGPHPLEDEGTF